MGYLLKATGQNWALVYELSAGALLIAAICWLFIDPLTPMAPVDEPLSA